jgi:hypothetical protein
MANHSMIFLSCKSMQKKQSFEMTPRKNGIRLTVKRLGSPTPLFKMRRRNDRR